MFVVFLLVFLSLPLLDCLSVYLSVCYSVYLSVCHCCCCFYFCFFICEKWNKSHKSERQCDSFIMKKSIEKYRKIVGESPTLTSGNSCTFICLVKRLKYWLKIKLIKSFWQKMFENEVHWCSSSDKESFAVIFQSSV